MRHSDMSANTCEAWIDIGDGTEKKCEFRSIAAAKKWLLEWLGVPSVSERDLWLIRDLATDRVVFGSAAVKANLEGYE